MGTSTFTLIDEQRVHEIEAELRDGRVRISPRTMTEVLGWTLEASGLCRADVCIPVAAADGLSADSTAVDLEQLARKLERPLVLDAEHRTAALAAPAAQRRSALASLQAPDFTLPDFEGHRHSLCEFRGKKVLLAAYASW